MSRMQERGGSCRVGRGGGWVAACLLVGLRAAWADACGPGLTTLTSNPNDVCVLGDAGASDAVRVDAFAPGFETGGIVRVVGNATRVTVGATGTLQNSPTGAPVVAVDAHTLSGGIVLEPGARITSAGDGIRVSGASTSVLGGIRNAGRINASGVGVRIASGSVSGGLFNSGRIQGALRSVWVQAGGSLDTIDIGGSSAEFVGEVLATNTALRVLAGASHRNGSAFSVRSLEVQSGATFVLDAAFTLASGLTNAGTFTLPSAASRSLTVPGTFANDGLLSLATGNAFTITGAFSNDGTVALASGSSLAISGGFAHGGTLDLAFGSSLSVGGPFVNRTSLAVPAGVAFATNAGIRNDALFALTAGHSLTVTGSFQNDGVLHLPAGSALFVSGNYLQAGVLRIGAANNGSFGHLRVSNTATLPSNAAIELDVTSGGLTTGLLADVLVAGTLMSDGSFAVTDNSLLFDFAAVLDGNSIDLQVLDPPSGGGGGGGDPGGGGGGDPGGGGGGDPGGGGGGDPGGGDPVGSGGGDPGGGGGDPSGGGGGDPVGGGDPGGGGGGDPGGVVRAPRTTGGRSLAKLVGAGARRPASGAAAVLDRLLRRPEQGDIVALGTVVDRFAVLPTEAALVAAVNETLPLLTSASPLAALGALAGANGVLAARQAELARGAGPLAEARPIGAGLAAGDALGGERALWLRPFASFSEQRPRTGAPGFESQARGLVLGGDFEATPVWRLGAGLAWHDADIGSAGPTAGATQRASLTGWQFFATAAREVGLRTLLAAQADVARLRTEGSRLLPTFGLAASSGFATTAVHAGLSASQRWRLCDDLHWLPALRADWTRLDAEGHRESGAGALDLMVERDVQEAAIITLEAGLEAGLREGIHLRARLGVGWDILAEQAVTTAAYAGGGPAFTTPGIRPAPVTGRGGVGLVAALGAAGELNLDYATDVREDFTRHSAALTLRWAF